ncbi:hypothetical protein KSP39_PZI007256 [Platanthera zijinensis]|uniref:Uncharacterized protein n=1 Tax=Platanthera zijinensis TaxID=2320716 RepID=A0AAP0G9Q0_9ASPA
MEKDGEKIEGGGCVGAVLRRREGGGREGGGRTYERKCPRGAAARKEEEGKLG